MGSGASFASKEALISFGIVLVLLVALTVFIKMGKQKALSTKSVVAIGIGAALYGALSFIMIPVGPNTSFRLAIAVLVIFGSLFGPIVGFLVGFIGHALNDALAYGSIWWSWVFLSAIMGMFSGFITLDKTYDVFRGLLAKKHIVKMYIYAVVSIFAASLVAYLGDVFLYGEPPQKVWIQIMIAAVCNFVVIALIGIPSILAISKKNSKNRDLELS